MFPLLYSLNISLMSLAKIEYFYKRWIGKRTETYWDLLPEGPGSCPHMAEDPGRGPLPLWKKETAHQSACVHLWHELLTHSAYAAKYVAQPFSKAHRRQQHEEKISRRNGLKRELYWSCYYLISHNMPTAAWQGFNWEVVTEINRKVYRQLY